MGCGVGVVGGQTGTQNIQTSNTAARQYGMNIAELGGPGGKGVHKVLHTGSNSVTQVKKQKINTLSWTGWSCRVSVDSL